VVKGREIETKDILVEIEQIKHYGMWKWKQVKKVVLWLCCWIVYVVGWFMFLDLQAINLNSPITIEYIIN